LGERFPSVPERSLVRGERLSRKGERFPASGGTFPRRSGASASKGGASGRSGGLVRGPGEWSGIVRMSLLFAVGGLLFPSGKNAHRWWKAGYGCSLKTWKGWRPPGPRPPPSRGSGVSGGLFRRRPFSALQASALRPLPEAEGRV